jgi:hypothetical protein
MDIKDQHLLPRQLVGTTLHSFTGIYIGNGSCYELLNKVLSNNEALERWRAWKTLFIDDVSMLDLTLFEKLEFIARRLVIFNFTRVLPTSRVFITESKDMENGCYCLTNKYYLKLALFHTYIVCTQCSTCSYMQLNY